MSSKLVRRVLMALLLLVVVAGGLTWLRKPKPVLVTLASVNLGQVESTIANTRAGTVEACRRAKLSATMGGRIEVLAVKEGDSVRRGQLLMKLWNEDQQAQSTLARAQVETARRRVTEVCTVAANAEREAQRQLELARQGFVSGSREEQARAEAQARRAGCDAAKADVNQAQARVAATQVEQRRTVLVAPFDGTVAKIVGEVGEYSTPSPPGVQMPPAVDLIDARCVYVKAPMDEVDAPKIRPGQAVRVSFDALPNQTFAGSVRRVAPTVSALEKQARTVDVEVDLSPPQEGAPTPRLLVGYSADVEVVLATRTSVLRLPTGALREGARVLVAGQDGTLQERRVKTGLTNWETTEVLEGLADGERVVTSMEREGVKAGAAFTVEETRTP